MTAHEALAVAQSFGVAVAAASAQPLAGGYSNESWHVRAPAAEVVVRRYGRMHVTTDALSFEHAVMRHAAARMPEVAAPLAGADGATFRLEGGAFVAVLPWIAGTTGARDLAAGRRAARLLARFHRAVRDLHVRGGGRSTRFLGLMPYLMERYKRFGAPGSAIARALPWDDCIVAVSASIARFAPLARRLPVLVVHGDPHPGNVVEADGEARGLIDFDFTHETERIADVGALLDEFGRDDDDGPLRLDRIAPLVEAYDREAPLTPDERTLLPDAILRHSAQLVSLVVTRHGERAPGDVGGALRYAERMREVSRLTAAIRDAR